MAAVALLHGSRERADLTAVGDRGRRKPPEEVLEHFPELPAHEAIQDRIQAAVWVRQTNGDREHVRVERVVDFVPVDHVKLDQDSPEGDGVVGQPA